jgi:hypothetical protein
MTMTGGCLCGAVRYEIEGAPIFAGNCYCKDCQKETGTGHLTIAAFPDAAVKLSGAVTTFTKNGDSGKPLDRGFCPKCGSTLYGRPQAMPGVTMIRAGTLDDPSAVKPRSSVYASRAVHWDPPPAGLPAFPELPPPRA